MVLRRSVDPGLVEALLTSSNRRSDLHIRSIFNFLRCIEHLSSLREGPLRCICKTARYEMHNEHDILYRRGQPSSCWYILLSGSVLIDGQLFLPGRCFGKRSSTSNRQCRPSDCIALEDSEMIAIDYPDVQAGVSERRYVDVSSHLHPQHKNRSSHPSSSHPLPPANGHRPVPPPRSNLIMRTVQQTSQAPMYHLSEDHPEVPSVSGEQYNNVYMNNLSNRSNRSSRSSEASSSGAGSWYITGSGSSAQHRGNGWPVRTQHSSDSAVDADLIGLPEHVVDEASDDDLEDLDSRSIPSGEGDSLSFGSTSLMDQVRDCLERDPLERTADDINVLLDFMQRMPAFAEKPQAVKRALCEKMVFALVQKRDTVVMEHGERLDSWCVVVNGDVEVSKPDGSRARFGLGQSFGVQAQAGEQFNVGTMRTLVDDCNFVVVAQEHYQEIMSRVQQETRIVTDTAGAPVICMERRQFGESQEGYIIVKGVADKLVEHLIEDRDRAVDPTFMEDFLLTYRVFVEDPVKVFDRLMIWFNDPTLRDKVVRVVLHWVNNHFNDFETSQTMMSMLDEFEVALESESLHEPVKLLNIACSVKSRTRTVTYTRSNRDELLHFSILGGSERAHNIFVSIVQPDSQASKAGLKRGDQIISVNNTSFVGISHQKALDLLRSSTHLSITVKSNNLGFKEMLADHDDSNTRPPRSAGLPAHHGTKLAPSVFPMPPQRKKSHDNLTMHRIHPTSTVSASTLPRYDATDCAVPPPPARHRHPMYDADPVMTRSVQESDYFSVGRLGRKIMNKATKLAHARTISQSSLPQEEMPSFEDGSTVVLQDVQRYREHRPHKDSLPNVFSVAGSPQVPPRSYRGPPVPNHHQTMERPSVTGSRMKPSYSNPDLSRAGKSNGALPGATLHGSGISHYYQPVKSQYPEHVLKVYRSNQTFKYLSLFRETTAHNVVMLALQEFGMNSASGVNYSLCEVTVTPEGVVKQRRLPDQMQSLAERLALNSRYYLKNNASTEPLVPDDISTDLHKDAAISLSSLSAAIVAAQLTLQDYAVFAAIEPTEYIDNLYEREKSLYGWPRLKDFEDLVERETHWVCTEILREPNLARRVKLVRKFIKIAKYCREFKNYNSMFAILAGLDKVPVQRLTATWERIPSRYRKMQDDLKVVINVSRNWSRYRQLLQSAQSYPPAIPICPVLKRDLFGFRYGNSLNINNMVHFELLRMISKEIRMVGTLASAPFQLNSMADICGMDPSNFAAVLYMNSFDGRIAVVRNEQRLGTVPRKRQYEQALMVRQAKQYLTSSLASVMTDERKLDELSLVCEAAAAPALNPASANSSGRGRASPAPSDHSSVSNISNQRANPANFGADSPQAVQKIMSLASSTRVRPLHAEVRPGVVVNSHRVVHSPAAEHVSPVERL